MQIRVNFETGEPPGCNVLNYAKPFNGMVYWHIRLSWDANKIVKLLMALKKNDKN